MKYKKFPDQKKFKNVSTLNPQIAPIIMRNVNNQNKSGWISQCSSGFTPSFCKGKYNHTNKFGSFANPLVRSLLFMQTWSVQLL